MADREREPGIRPRQTTLRMLDAAARRAVPLAFCVIVLLLLHARPGLPGASALSPGLLLASVFFWSVFRPASMPAVGVFLLGLLSDLLGGAIPGLAAFLLLGTHALAITWRAALSRFGFLAMWLVFVLIASGCCALQWGIASLWRLQALPLAPAVFELALACAAYPPLSASFTWAHRSIADPGQA